MFEERVDAIGVAEAMATVINSLLECEGQNDGTQEIINNCMLDAFLIMRASLRKAVLEHAMPEMK